MMVCAGMRVQLPKSHSGPTLAPPIPCCPPPRRNLCPIPAHSLGSATAPAHVLSSGGLAAPGHVPALSPGSPCGVP